MKQKDREKLISLLTKLISAQREVTRNMDILVICNGPQKETLNSVAVRNGVRNEIIEFVDSLIEKYTQGETTNRGN